MICRRRELIVALICFAICALLTMEICGQDRRPPLAFQLVQGGVVMGNGIDLGMSIVAVYGNGAPEYNPIGSWVLRRPPVAIAYMGALNLGFVWATDQLWKSNRTLAWIVAGASLALKAYVIAHNLSVLPRR